MRSRNRLGHLILSPEIGPVVRSAHVVSCQIRKGPRQRIFEELLSFIDNNIDSKILQKANDVTTFLHKSFTDLDIITKN